VDPAAAFAAMSDAVLAVARERELEPVLDRIVHTARDLSGARYAALGVPDEDGASFTRFLTAGLTDAEIEAIGPLPRTHGLLGSMLGDPHPYRTGEVRDDPRAVGWWPGAHPDMHQFLGVPIVSKGEVIGALYLTDREDGRPFDDDDQRLMEVLAAHAAVAIDNERSRELNVAEERNRLARELHDAMTQTLFSLSLVADAAATHLHSDPDLAAEELHRVRHLARAGMAELRSLVFELRPVELEVEGLGPALAKNAAVLERAHGVPVSVECRGERRLDPGVEREVFRIASEALHNALRHATPSHVQVALDTTRGVRLTVTDDGTGFLPDAPAIGARRLGLTSMRERAAALGGELDVRSAPGEGTTVLLVVAGG
jgi:signal transduction histidine kinase